MNETAVSPIFLESPYMDTVYAGERETIFVIVEKQSPTQTFLCVVALHIPPAPPPTPPR